MPNHGENVGSISVLTEEEIKIIHGSALTLLEKSGIVIEHPQALKLLAKAGAEVDESSHWVRIPGHVVEEAIRKAPSEFLLAGREESLDLHLAHIGKTYTRTVGGPDFLYDWLSKTRRPVTRQDLIQWTRLADRLEHIHLINAIFPQDLPDTSRDVQIIAIMLRNTAKPLLIQAYTGRSLEWIIKLASCVMGGNKSLRKRPIFAVYTSCLSPLKYCFDEVDVLITAGNYGIPVFLNSSPLAGASGPVTLAGSLLLMNVETLAGMVVAQLANPGAPVIYTPKPYFFDMRSTVAAIGYAEMGLLQSAIIQLGQFYRWPTEALGAVTDSKLPDQQAGIEKILGAQLSFHAGASIVGGAGALGAGGTVSLEQLTIDDDIFGCLYRIVRGVEMNEEHLAAAAIAELKSDPGYLTHEHTLSHFREEYFFPKIMDRQRHESWEESGAKDMATRAHDRTREILNHWSSRIKELEFSSDFDQLLAEAMHDLRQKSG